MNRRRPQPPRAGAPAATGPCGVPGCNTPWVFVVQDGRGKGVRVRCTAHRSVP